jgi:serine acetyltransferase
MGAKIIENITVGDDVTIAAGTVVTHDVASGCSVAGIPARLTSKKLEYQKKYSQKGAIEHRVLLKI